MIPIYNYIIIEDEPLQQDYLKDLLGTRIELNCVNVFDHHRPAYDFLIDRKNPTVDIIFLDIELPGKYDGLNFLKSLQANLQTRPSVIIVSAYPEEYALLAFEHPVSGFVAKPIVEEKLHKAIDKAISGAIPYPSVPGSSTKPEYYDFKVGTSVVRIFSREILFCESKNVDVRIFKIDEKMIESRMTLTTLEAILPASHFLRIQNSYIANMKYLSGYARNHHEIELKNPNTGKAYKIQVGNKFREKLKEFLEHGSNSELQHSY